MKLLLTMVLVFMGCLCCTAQVDNIRMLQRQLPLIKDSAVYVDILNRIAILQYEQNIDSTWYFTKAARAIAERLGYKKGLADATNNLGVTYDIKGSNQFALRYYNSAYNQYKAIGDSANIVQTLMNIAMVYTSAGKADKAVENYNRALSMGNTLTNDSIMSLVIYNYLLQYPSQFSADSVKMLLGKAMAIATRYHDVRLLLAIQQLNANNLMAAGRRDEGIALLQQTVDAGFKEHLYFMTLDVLVELGDLFVETDSAKAIAYYKQALGITEKRFYYSYAQMVMQRLYDFYLARHNDAQAFYYAQNLLQIHAKQDKENRNTAVDYIEYAIKDQQLTAAREKSAYNARLVWLAGIACALTLIAAFILWRSVRLSRQTNYVLRQQFNKLEATTEELEKSNRQYASLHKVIAHDLRNPVGAISSISAIMMENESEHDRDWIRMINESSRRCLQLITELLETDLSVREISLHKEAVNLHDILEQTVAILAFKAKEKRQQLVLNDAVQPVLQADAEQLGRVFDNLLANAIKFSPAESNITISVNNKGANIVVAVKDEGIGIPREMAAQLFDPFTSAKRMGTAGEPTYGLGLYICKQVVEAHGGSIWFESEEGNGATFFVQLKK